MMNDDDDDDDERRQQKMTRVKDNDKQMRSCEEEVPMMTMIKQIEKENHGSAAV